MVHLSLCSILSITCGSLPHPLPQIQSVVSNATSTPNHKVKVSAFFFFLRSSFPPCVQKCWEQALKVKGQESGLLPEVLRALWWAQICMGTPDLLGSLRCCAVVSWLLLSHSGRGEARGGGLWSQTQQMCSSRHGMRYRSQEDETPCAARPQPPDKYAGTAAALRFFRRLKNLFAGATAALLRVTPLGLLIV